jgi:hypothetical protein
MAWNYRDIYSMVEFIGGEEGRGRDFVAGSLIVGVLIKAGGG